MTDSRFTELANAIELAGGPVKLSLALGLHKTAVYKWGYCPPPQVIPVCKLIDWKVTPHQLRHDIYPNESDGMPVSSGG